MNADHPWRIFLESSGAEFTALENGTRLTGFASQSPAAAPAPDCHLTALTHLGLLQAAGPDSEKFLQGQLTCDVSRLTTGLSSLGAACTPQGRVYSSFRLIRATQTPELSFLLRLSADNLERTRETLAKYAVFYKTELEDTRDRYVGIGIWGSAAAATLGEHFTVPQAVNEVAHATERWLVRVPGKQPRFECWLPEPEAEALWPQLAAVAQCHSPDTWILEDIRAGLAEIGAATTEDFIPHMLNYQKMDAISFTKGCYTGQEIVARTEYRGKAKRGLFRLETGAGITLEPGTELTSPTLSGAVHVISSAPAGHDVQEALVVMATGMDAGADLALELNDLSVPARLLPLPE